MKKPIDYTDATWNVLAWSSYPLVTDNNIRLESIPRGSYVYMVYYFIKEQRRRAYLFAHITYPMTEEDMYPSSDDLSEAIFEGTIVSTEPLQLDPMTRIPSQCVVLKYPIPILDKRKEDWNLDGDEMSHVSEEMKPDRDTVDNLVIAFDDWKNGVYGNTMDYICKLHEIVARHEEAIMYREALIFIKVVRCYLINCTALEYKPKMNVEISEKENTLSYDFSITKNNLKCSFARSFVVDPAFNYFSMRTVKDIKNLVNKAAFLPIYCYNEKEEKENKREKDFVKIVETFNECVTKIQNDRLKI